MVIRVGAIGCGAVSELYYSPALQELERLGQVQVVSLFDPDTARFETVRQAFPQAKRAATVEDMVPEIDLAIVASPVRFHAQQSVQLLDAGVAVLCEKPMAATVAEAQQMLAAAERSQKPLAIGLFRRFFPAARAIKAAIATGSLGSVTSFQFSEGGKFNWPTRSAAFFSPQAPGGVLFDLGVHLLDLMLWWFGDPCSTNYRDDGMGGVEINSHLQCEFPAGFLGQVRMSWDSPLPNRYLIQFERGWLSWRVGDAGGLQMGLQDVPLGFEMQLREERRQGNQPALGDAAHTYAQCFIDQLLNVCAAVRGEADLEVPAREGIRSLRLLGQCYAQRQLVEMPWLSEVEWQRAAELQAERGLAGADR
ncbi:Gfo/Idh/MocA family protein [Synechococcus sp. PCC 7336]|uniref:Gfo/Idh/MocA family oxidoreductase n=1 Tax=Synechococcus sp. PCC 7336 TaxID=195250 RepID=UPI00034DC34B|nr:Gfo/Idh/MocA family oxidoreductase [Synechococcus sp. PCC 7336]